MFTIDSIEWEYPCTIEREAEIRESDISGLMLNKTYFRDVIGTFLKYDVAIAVPLDDRGAYTTIYELLTAPVGFHSFVFPYNQTTVSITGSVEVVNDVFVRTPNDGKYWRGIKFSVISNAPTKTQTQGEAVAYGLPAYPSNVDPEDGDTYMYIENVGWTQVEYQDADDMYF